MDYVIETDFQGPGFVAVPNHVAQRRGLAPDALGLLVYLASQPRGFIVRWSVICAHFGMGKDRWQRIGRELRAIGAMELQQVRGAGGRVIGRRVMIRWPQPVADEAVTTENRESPLSDRKPEKPAAGKSAKVSGQIRKSERANPAPYKEERLKTVSGEGGALSPFQRACLREGKAVLIGRDLLKPGSLAFQAAALAVRSQDALEKTGGVCHGAL